MKFLKGILVVIVILTGIIIWQNITYPERKYKNDMEILNSEINGRISSLYVNHGFSEIRLNNSGNKIKIGFIIEKSGDKELFKEHIQINDSIYSPIGSDSIFVIRNGIKKGFKVYLDFGK